MSDICDPEVCDCAAQASRDAMARIRDELLADPEAWDALPDYLTEPDRC